MYIGHTNDGYGPGLVGPYPDEEISNGMLWDPAMKKRLCQDILTGGII